MSANKSKGFYGSKYFESEVVSLRQAVSDYLHVGVCITTNTSGDVPILRSNGVIEAVCKEIAKQRGTPFVTLWWYTPDTAIVTIPNLQKTKPLFGPALLVGSKFNGRISFGGQQDPILVEENKLRVKIYYQGFKGMEALKGWMNMVQTENRLRYILGLPPKVSPSAHAIRSA